MAEIINLNDYRENKPFKDMFEETYLQLLHCLGTPNNQVGISIAFYAFIRYMGGLVNTLRILDICSKVEEPDLDDLKQQMITHLQGIIEDIKEV